MQADSPEAPPPHTPAGVFLRGMAMGAADVVPGVSGGTVAFVTGIYDELLDTLSAVDLRAWRVWREEGFRRLWQHLNGVFLLALFSGIFTSILSLAQLIEYLLATYPEPVWGFFFGLIVASVVHVGRSIPHWRGGVIVALVVGMMVAYGITRLPPLSVSTHLAVFFFSGMLAICAMILPGISGSFILLLLGMYQPVLAAVKGFQVSVLAVFCLGCGMGLLLFSRILSWMLHHYRALTLALLTGFMVGSLDRIWPWKHTLSWRVDRHGEQVPALQESVLPWSYEALTGQAPVLGITLVCGLLGIVIVVLLEQLGRPSQRA